ncbi:hypothetical protein K4F52_009337 [Lecanicillium sp. MT-2017a]|nr:hypothetical protein K4F52_009337 [Lecanicillium sp. MT-2017a]
MYQQTSLIGALSLLLAHVADAQQCMQYATAIVTTCGAVPTIKPVVPHEVLTITMPDCWGETCDKGAVCTKSYTTVCPVPNPTGTTDHTWTVEEIYRGITAVPSVAPTGGVPHGYTTFVDTCTVEGGVATKTFTVPKGAPTWADYGNDQGQPKPDNNGNKKPNNGTVHPGPIPVPKGDGAALGHQMGLVLAAVGAFIAL